MSIKTTIYGEQAAHVFGHKSARVLSPMTFLSQPMRKSINLQSASSSHAKGGAIVVATIADVVVIVTCDVATAVVVSRFGNLAAASTSPTLRPSKLDSFPARDPSLASPWHHRFPGKRSIHASAIQ